MSDQNNAGIPDPTLTRVLVDNPYEVRRWCQRLVCTEKQLREVVAEVGSSPDAFGKWRPSSEPPESALSWYPVCKSGAPPIWKPRHASSTPTLPEVAGRGRVANRNCRVPTGSGLRNHSFFRNGRVSERYFLQTNSVPTPEISSRSFRLLSRRAVQSVKPPSTIAYV